MRSLQRRRPSGATIIDSFIEVPAGILERNLAMSMPTLNRRGDPGPLGNKMGTKNILNVTPESAHRVARDAARLCSSL